MLYSGLRSAEVLGLHVEDVDVARGWVLVCGKGGRERRVPVDREVAGLIQTYLLVERPETEERALFVVAKGPHRGRPLSPAGLRAVFRYHRARSGAPRAHPHALRHTFGTALAEAGIDLPVICSVTSTSIRRSAMSISRRRTCAPPSMPPARSSAPRAEPAARLRAVRSRDALLVEYQRGWPAAGAAAAPSATGHRRSLIAGSSRRRSPRSRLMSSSRAISTCGRSSLSCC